MTISDFRFIFQEFEKGFGVFSNMKRERIYYFCQDMSADSFRRLCVGFVDNDNKPGVAAFRAGARAFKHSGPQDPKQSPNYEHELCAGVGVLSLTNLDDKSVETLCYCYCYRGLKCQGRQRLPVYSKRLEKAWKPHSLTAEKMLGFQPKDAKAWLKFGASWAAKLSLAEEFWKNQPEDER